MFKTIVCTALAAAAHAAPVPVVPSLNVTQYMGEWYQLADYPQFYEILCKDCTTATYTLEKDGTVGVHNECRSSKTADPTGITGVATIPDSKEPAKLKVKFFKLFSADYWIMKLGPLVKNQYSYALVSDPTRESCYVLSRTPTVANSTLAEIHSFLSDNGFDLNKLRHTDQAGCWKEPEPVFAAAAPASVCNATEYCCPDAKHCLTPTKVSCSADPNVCSKDQACCPITKLCVDVGAPCTSPCADQGSYCCPDALHCLTPTNPGTLCKDNKECGEGGVCCPVTHECVSVGAKCVPP